VLREVAHLTPGETVVVHASAGGVGSSLLVRRLTTPEVEELAQQVMHLRYRVRRP
jgi:hypothetical protein